MSQMDTKATDPLVKEQLTLLIERELRYQLDEILQRMQQMAKDFNIGGQGDKRSPLRNLLVTATDRTASLEVIKNYIEYQTARSEDIGKILKVSLNGKKFGAALVAALDELEQDANAILNNIESSLKPHNTSARSEQTGDASNANHPVIKYLNEERSREVIDLHLKLVQLYLGYLVREHTALRESQNNNRFQPESQSGTSPGPRRSESNRNR